MRIYTSAKKHCTSLATLDWWKSLFLFRKNLPVPRKGLLRYGWAWNYCTVRLDFGKKYDTELRTEFLEKVRYGNTVLCFPYRIVLFPYSSNARFALLLPSTALFLLTYEFTPSIALSAHTTSHPSQYFK